MPTAVGTTGFIDSDIRIANVGTPSKKVAEFRVNDGSTWITVVAWEELADLVPAKGSPIFVAGRLRTRSYDKDGHKVYVTEVVATLIQPLGAVEPAGEELFAD